MDSLLCKMARFLMKYEEFLFHVAIYKVAVVMIDHEMLLCVMPDVGSNPCGTIRSPRL